MFFLVSLLVMQLSDAGVKVVSEPQAHIKSVPAGEGTGAHGSDGANDATDGAEISKNSPYDTVYGFLRAMSSGDIESALGFFPSSLDPFVKSREGPLKAYQIVKVVDRTVHIRHNSLSKDPHSISPYVVSSLDGEPVVSLSYIKNDGWYISPSTIDGISSIYSEIKNRPTVAHNVGHSLPIPISVVIRSFVPDIFILRVLNLEIWVWISIFVILLLGILGHKVSSVILNWVIFSEKRRLGGWLKKEGLVKNISRPIGYIVQTIIWWMIIGILDQGALYDTFVYILKGVTYFCVVWIIIGLLDLTIELFARRPAWRNVDKTIITITHKSLRALVVFIGFLVLLSNIGINVTAVLAALGGTSIALGFAARNSIENFFGSLAVLFDKPFEVGDRIQIGDEIEGFVEDLGIRSTRVRTFHDSVLTIPNSLLLTRTVDNYSNRRARRFEEYISITYRTPPAKIEAFRSGIDELVSLQPSISTKDRYVRFTRMAASSLDILVYCYFDVGDWHEEQAAREHLLLDIVRLAEALNVEFAFPTQTIDFQKEGIQAEAPWKPFVSTTAVETGRMIAKDIRGQGPSV